MKLEFPDFGYAQDEISQARRFRWVLVQSQYDQGYLTEAEARELLAGRLSPNDPNTVIDDSEFLRVKK